MAVQKTISVGWDSAACRRLRNEVLVLRLLAVARVMFRRQVITLKETVWTT